MATDTMTTTRTSSRSPPPLTALNEMMQPETAEGITSTVVDSSHDDAVITTATTSSGSEQEPAPPPSSSPLVLPPSPAKLALQPTKKKGTTTTTRRTVLVGNVVHCPPFGDGKVTSQNSETGISTIRLAFGTMYASEQGIASMSSKHHDAWKQKQQRLAKSPSSVSSCASNDTAGTCSEGDEEEQDNGATMALNVAYEALETMRMLNLELHCQEVGVKFDASKCTKCLLSQQQPLYQPGSSSNATTTTKKGTPCFICASPTCKSHSCPKFRKEGNTVCNDCKHLFSLDYVLDIMTMTTTAAAAAAAAESAGDDDCGSDEKMNKKKKQHAQEECMQLITRMLDTYDRTVLVLKYSSQFMPEICHHLEHQKSFKNKVGIGSSSVGLVSGSLGIAATACLLTPLSAVFAPPLIIASILCGGTSTAMQTGVEMGTQYSEPNQLATRIIALYGMCKSILRTVDVLQGVVDMLENEQANRLADGKVMQLLASRNDESAFAANHIKAGQGLTAAVTTATAERANTCTSRSRSSSPDNRSTEDSSTTKPTTTTTKSTTLTTTTTTTTEAGSAARKNAQFITRSGANSVSMGSNAVSASGNALSATAMTAAQFATFAGGALSAAVLVCEAHSMTQTIIDMRNGSKCPRADLLRQILLELKTLPTTMELEQQCHESTEALTTVYPRSMSQDDAAQLLIDLLGPDRLPGLVAELKRRDQEKARQERRRLNNKNNNRNKGMVSRSDSTDDSTVRTIESSDDCNDVMSEEMLNCISKAESENKEERTSVDSETESVRTFDSSRKNDNKDDEIVVPALVGSKPATRLAEAAASDPDKTPPRRNFWKAWSFRSQSNVSNTSLDDDSGHHDPK